MRVPMVVAQEVKKGQIQPETVNHATCAHVSTKLRLLQSIYIFLVYSHVHRELLAICCCMQYIISH